ASLRDWWGLRVKPARAPARCGHYSPRPVTRAFPFISIRSHSATVCVAIPRRGRGDALSLSWWPQLLCIAGRRRKRRASRRDPGPLFTVAMFRPTEATCLGRERLGSKPERRERVG